MQVPLGVALTRLIAETGLPAIGHHHDYWWERSRFADCIVPELLDEAFPPNLPGIKHVSINTLAAGELQARRGIGSDVVPNVYDFDQPVPSAGGDARLAMRRELSMGPEDLLVVQPTRVVPRKGIELTIELVGRLEDPRAVILITGPSGDEGHRYLADLKHQARVRGVALRYRPERFAPDHDGPPIGPAHSLSDAYQAADLIAYPSLYEGFGNALLESVFYGRPLLVNRYSVYVADIAPRGFHFIEVDQAITDTTVSAVRALLADPERRAEEAAHNRAIARQHFGYGVLREYLRVSVEALRGT
jgi:glycosyltransferase involved in cell wall biosynthesis